MLKIDKDGSSYSYTVYSAGTLPAGFRQIGTSNSYELLDSGVRVSVIKPYIEEAYYSGAGSQFPVLYGNHSGGVGDINTTTGLQYQLEHATNSSNTYSTYDCAGVTPSSTVPLQINILSMLTATDYAIRFSGVAPTWYLTREV